MHPCPCCGYRTLPERGNYDLCPVCWWEDDGSGPWEYSDPNGCTLVEAQQEFLAERRPYRRRPGKVRAPRRREAREPSWQPFEVTDDLLARLDRANAARRQAWERERRHVAEEIAENPEGPFKEYNAAVADLSRRAPSMSHREVRAELGDLVRTHQLRFSRAHVELVARLVKDPDYYRGHPGRMVWWLLRHARRGTVRRRWTEVRTGTFHFAG